MKASIPDRALAALAFAALLFLAWRSWNAGENDFIAYYNAGARALAGESPYRELEPTPFRYLPATAYVFAPLAIFPLKVARLLLFVANFAAIVGVYRAIRARTSALATFLLVALFAKFHNHDFQNAQVNPILLFLFLAWWKLRERNVVLSTLAFTGLASFKILPLALGLPLVVLGAWREIAWIALWAVTLNFLPVFLVDRGPLVFADWWAQARLIDDPVMLPNVQSIQAAVWWQLQGHVELSTFQKFLHPMRVALVAAAIAIAPREAGRRESWIFASVLALTAVFAPLAWKHNYLLFLPLAALWFVEDPAFRERRTRVLYGIALAGLVVLPSAIGHFNRGFADRLYLPAWTGLALVFLGLRCSRSRSAAGSCPRSASGSG